ncbi:MAG: tyrosine-type recombinase/integrase [Eubacterium sp.]|nr:tyrosine-type recombinase/integrase [Eubacterium sp.]
MKAKEQMERFREYLMEEERSENTINTYLDTLGIFFDNFPEISKQNMLKFKQLQLETRKPKTVHNRIVAMNQFCKFTGHPEWCVKQIKIQNSSSVENVISVQEFNKLLNGLKEDGNVRGYFFVKFLAKTGARASEFVRLDKSGLDKGYCEMWTKGKIRRIYIPRSLIEESREYFKGVEGELLFPSRCGRQMTTRGVAQNIKTWAAKYEIRKEVAYPHSFRHLFAIEFLKRNPNISLLADLMGHSNVQTTSIYLKLSKEEQMKQFNEASGW